MDKKQFMLSSLKGLLLEGETLYHPIYGVLEQSGVNRSGFFGFTDTCLLVVLINGNDVLCSERIELDIKSFSYKQKGKKYVFNITFADYFSMKIHAHEKPLFRDEQEKTLGGFTRFLSSKAPANGEASIVTAEGQKIRRQYFTFALYCVYMIFVMICVTYAVFDIRAGNFVMGKWISTCAEVGFVLLPLFAVFLVLYFANRAYFGRVIAVLGEKGIYTEQGLFEWKDIRRAVYCPQISKRYQVRYNYVQLFVEDDTGNEQEIKIEQFPYYGLRAIKKVCPSVKTKMSKHGKILITVYLLIPFAVLLVSLLKSI